jgi:hypothetical protein
MTDRLNLLLVRIAPSNQPAIAKANSELGGQALQSAGLVDTLAERLSQIEEHGFDQIHDLGHHPGQLAAASASYLNAAIDQLNGRNDVEPVDPATWPWEREAWRPGDARANIVKALAIGLAVLDRMDASR